MPSGTRGLVVILTPVLRHRRCEPMGHWKDRLETVMVIVLELCAWTRLNGVMHLLNPGKTCFDDEQCDDLEQVMRER
jgi:hypothetical protein